MSGMKRLMCTGSQMRRWLCRAGAMATIAGAAYANTYIWDGAGANDYWDNSANWDPLVIPGTYPNADTDDAIIPATGGPHDVQLITEQIDDLTITGSVDLTPKSGTPTLTLDTLTISGGTSGTVAAISGATISAQP